MPIQSCTLSSGGKGFKWGEQGHCYASREQALKQMRAIFHSGYKGKALLEEDVNDIVASLSDAEFDELIGDIDIDVLTRISLSTAKKKIKIPKDSKTGKSQLPNAAGPF